MKANNAACPGTPAGVVAFDAPTPWDGSCTAMDAIPSAASFEAPPPALVFSLSEGCNPSVEPPIKLAGGTTRALICGAQVGVPSGTCQNPADTCTLSKAAGFLSCIYGNDGEACPEGWPNTHVIFEDGDECICGCGSPQGEQCTSTLSVYADDVCSQLLGSAMVSSALPDACIDTAPGSPFGSKSATPPVYQSGTCTPSLTKSRPQTICCEP
jgi:hypothetical protein